MSNVIKFRGKTAKAISPCLAYDALSFIKGRKPKGGGHDYWSVLPSGNYPADCETGRFLATEYLTFIGNYPTVGNATLLNCIVREMVEKATIGKGWSGVHLGFIRTVNEFAMATAVMAQARGSPAKSKIESLRIAIIRNALG